jgi:sugar phosphate isomerase/epimerase
VEIVGHSHSFSRVLGAGASSLAAVLRYFWGLDLRAVELMDSHITDADRAAVHATLVETGLTVACYDLRSDFVTPDPAARAAEVARLQAGLERAAAVGARYVLTYPGTLKPGIAPEDARQWFAGGLRACLPLAARLGLTLTIADIGTQAALCGTSDHLNAICDAVGPALRVTYDVGNFLLAGEDPLEALEQVGPRIVHVHVKDWHVLPATAPPPRGAFTGLDGRHYSGAVLGEGILNLPGVLARLAEMGYRGYLSLEYEGTDEPWEAVQQGVAYLRTLLSRLPAEQ